MGSRKSGSSFYRYLSRLLLITESAANGLMCLDSFRTLLLARTFDLTLQLSPSWLGYNQNAINTPMVSKAELIHRRGELGTYPCLTETLQWGVWVRGRA